MQRIKSFSLATLIAAVCAIFFFFIFAAHGQTTSYVTAVVDLGTSPDCPTNGFTFSINGHVRTWTNNVTAANNQIQTPAALTNGVGIIYPAATNLWVAYSDYPETSPSVNVTMTGARELTFTGIPGQALVISTNWPAGSNAWVSWVYYTNYITMAWGLRGPTNAVGITENSNTTTALIQYLSSSNLAAAIDPTMPQWSNFVQMAVVNALSNWTAQLGTNCTNLTLEIGTNSTNFTLTMGTNLTNFSSNFSLLLSVNGTNYTDTASNGLYSIFGPLLGSIFPWQDTSMDVYLTNGWGSKRFIAYNGGAIEIYFYDGSTKWAYLDGANNTFIDDTASTHRIEIGDPSGATLGTYIRSVHGQAICLSTNGTFYIDQPAVMQSQVAPSVIMGTYTNFTGQAQNSGSSDTIVDSFSLPANTMTNDGDCIIRTIGIALSSSGANKRAQVNCASTQIYDTTSTTATGAGGFSITCEMTRLSSSTLAYNCHANGYGSTGTAACKVGTITGVDFTSAMPNSLTITSSGAGSASSQVTVLSDNVKLAPSAFWAQLP